MFSAVPKIDNLCTLTTFNMLIAFSVFYSSLFHHFIYWSVLFVGRFAESTMSVRSRDFTVLDNS